MHAYQTSPDCIRIDLNADDARELLSREGSIPSAEWALIRPQIVAFNRSSAMTLAFRTIEEQKKRIAELEQALSETVILKVEGDVS